VHDHQALDFRHHVVQVKFGGEDREMFHQAPQWSLLPAVFRGAALPVTFRKVSSAKEGRHGGLMRISFSGRRPSRV
jgi:hypothetical protein